MNEKDILQLLIQINPIMWQEFKIEPGSENVEIVNHYLKEEIQIHGIELISQHPEIKRLINNYINE